MKKMDFKENKREFEDPYAELLDLNHFYIVENMFTKEMQEFEYENFLEDPCECLEICENDCKCLKNGFHNYIYDKNDKKSKTLILNLDKSDNNIIFECNENCKCNSNRSCRNRLVQFGPNQKLEIKKTSKYKGKGIFAKENIHPGEFICEYAGEVLTESEALVRQKNNEKNGKMNYIFCLNEFFGENNYLKTFIDPTFYGNIGRYLNHSCDPNCRLEIVRINHLIPKICIFAKNFIGKNLEITFDYGEKNFQKDSDLEKKLTPCLCNEPNCKKFLPYFQ